MYTDEQIRQCIQTAKIVRSITIGHNSPGQLEEEDRAEVLSQLLKTIEMEDQGIWEIHLDENEMTVKHFEKEEKVVAVYR